MRFIIAIVLFVVAGNPLATSPELGLVRAGFARPELFSVVHDVVEAAAPLAVSSGSTVRVRSELSRCTVQGDQRRIERILRNLVVNALEHGEGRPIDIVVGASEVAAAVVAEASP